MFVCLDPGHGGAEWGGCANGLKEKDLVLDIALRTKPLLMARGISVLMTRETDVAVSITQRYTMANNAGVDLFISIHTDAYYEVAHGFSILWYTASTRDTIGMMMREELLAAHNDWHSWIYGDYAGVLTGTTMPAILTESLFVTNKQDAALLASPEFRQKLAEAHARAICKYFKIPYEGEEEGDMSTMNLRENEKQGDMFVWATSSPFTTNDMWSRVECWLTFYNESTRDAEVLLWCNTEGNKDSWPQSIALPKWKRKAISLKQMVGDHSGFSIIIKCRERNINPELTMMCK
jgi:N-acetylmuramoyl-L-alanine amidase